MKICRTPATVALIAATLWLATGCAESTDRLASGDATPWKEWEGRWIVINYWAEWCEPCRKEIPELNMLHRDADGPVVAGVNFDGITGTALTELIERMQIEFPVLVEDPRGRWDLPLPSVLPSTLLVDPDGNVVSVLVGPQTHEALSRAMGTTAEM